MSRFHHKGAANQIRRPRYAAMNLLTSWIGAGTISALYDITFAGGALDQLDNPVAGTTGDEIWECPNMLAADGGTGNPLIFTALGQAESPSSPRSHLTWRKGIRLSNGLLSSPKIPFAYYPEGFVNDIWSQMQTNGSEPDNTLLMQVLVMGHLTDGAIGWADPLPENFPGLTYGIFGCQAIYESQAFIDGLNASSPGALASLSTFPAPDMPDSVIYEQRVVTNVDLSISVRTRIWIGNVLSHDQTQPILVSGVPATSTTQLTGEDMFSQLGMLFGLFCFATQKLFYINKLLTDEERLELHDALVGTSEHYGHG